MTAFSGIFDGFKVGQASGSSDLSGGSASFGPKGSATTQLVGTRTQSVFGASSRSLSGAVDEGAAAIAQVATVNTLRRDTGTTWIGDTLTVTGSRVALFPFDPDWSNPVKEKVQYLTKIMPSRNGNEQRIALRTKARRAITFSIFPGDELQSQLLDALLVDALPSVWGAPWWNDATTYQGTLAAGATSIAVATTNTSFAFAPMVAIWSDPWTFEVQTIQSASAGALQISALTKAWTRPILVPVFPARIGDSLRVERETSKYSGASITFQMEPA